MSPIPLSEYPRPPHDNGRGVHWSANLYPVSGENLDYWLEELKALQIKWVKLLDDGGGSSIPLCRALVENEIMPIVRLYRERPNPGHIGVGETAAIKRLIDIGVRYFETNNEPYLPAEWKDGFLPDNWLDIVVDNFIYDADIIYNLGGLPGYPTMLGLEKIVERGRKDIFERGAWLAIHNYTLNHPLDYPYDPVNQEGRPLTQEEYDRLARWQYSHLTWEEIQEAGIEISRENYEKFNRWAWDGRSLEIVNDIRKAHKNPGATIFDDSNCFRGWELAGHKVLEALGFYIPVISTEGGPVVGWGDDDRYAKVNPTTHAQWQMEIVRFLQDEAPPWYFTSCSWLLASVPLDDINPTSDQQSWYTHAWDLQFGLDGQLPIVQLLKDTPAQIRHELRPAQQTATVMGVVTDSNKQPVSGAHLALQTKTGETISATLSDEKGRYKLMAPPGVYDIFIKWHGPAVRDVSLKAFDTDIIDIENIDPTGQFEIWGYVQNEKQNLSNLEVSLFKNSVMLAQTTTDDTGKYVFRPGLAGEYLLESFDTSITASVTPQNPIVRQDIKLQPTPPLRYTLTKVRLLEPDEAGSKDIFYGTVRDKYGRGLNGIELEMRWTGAEPDTKFPRTKTGYGVDKWDGYYEFWHSKGTFLIEVVQGDMESDIAQLDTVNVPGEHITYEVDFQTLPIETQAAESAIYGSIPGGRLEQTVTLWKDGKSIAETSLNNSRTFKFEKLPAGIFDLELAGIGIFATGITLDGRTETKIKFPLMGAIAGTVDDAPHHKSIKLISETYGFIRHSEISDDGKYRFIHLPPGTYRIELDEEIISGIHCDGESVVTAPSIKLGAAKAPAHSKIKGRVHDTANRPTPNVKVSLQIGENIIATANTDADGLFQFSTLNPGIYDVRINQFVGMSGIVLDGENLVEIDLLYTPVASAAPKRLARYYLLRMADAKLTPALLRLVGPWLPTQPAGMIGFSLDQALQANTVVLLGDGLPDNVPNLLQKHDGEVIDMRGDLLELAEKLKSPVGDAGDSHD